MVDMGDYARVSGLVNINAFPETVTLTILVSPGLELRRTGH